MIENLIPYYGDTTVKEQLDNLFSREILGAVLVGKFVGDYVAILARETMGTHLGYIAGILTSISLFIYWEKVEIAKEEAQDTLGMENQERLDSYIE